MTFASNTKLSRKADILQTDLGDEVIALNVEIGDYHTMKSTAQRIWNVLEEDKTVDELVTSLCAVYDVSAEVCLRDITPFLESLEAAQLISVER